MGVLKELKELVKEMGGNASQAQTIGQAVDKIPAAGGGALIVKYNESGCDKIAAEIISASKVGPVIFMGGELDNLYFNILTSIEFERDNVGVIESILFQTTGDTFSASGLDEYPTIVIG